MLIRKVYENKYSKQLLVTVPINQGIKKDDYVLLEKVVLKKKSD